MRILILGGTAWLGGQVARTALDHGHDVTCLARGEAGSVPPGAALVRADRSHPRAYDEVAGQDWDAVVDVTWQPGFVRSATVALEGRVGHWVYVSSCSVYADHGTPGDDESAALLPALESDTADRETYGEAKVACESLLRGAVGEQRCTLARAGLIGGPGDHTDRTTYWPSRFAAPAGPAPVDGMRPGAADGAVLVPDSPTLSTQVIDVRDLAAWLVHCAEARVTGAYNVSGHAMSLPDHLATARRVAGHTGPLVPVDQDWLIGHQVEPWAGPRSLPLWLPLPEYAGFCARDIGAALSAGLALRPLAETLADGLAWAQQRRDSQAPTRDQTPDTEDGPRAALGAGLTDDEERELLEAAHLSSPDRPAPASDVLHLGCPGDHNAGRPGVV
jgi:nucleoside-diphosphate-sugar epimerase